MRRTSTSVFPKFTNPRIMVYIKPYDESVYENFFIFIKTIQNLEVRYKITLETTVPEDLFDSYAKSHELRQKHGLTKGLSKFN